RRARVHARQLFQYRPYAEQGEHVLVRHQTAQSVADHRIVGQLQVADQLQQPRHVRAQLPARREVDAFSRERAAGDLPAGVDLADDHFVRYEDLVQEHLVEDLLPGHLPQRAYLDAGRRHVDQEVRDPVVLRRGWVGTREADAPLRVLRQGCPD